MNKSKRKDKSLVRIKTQVRSTPASLNISEFNWPNAIDRDNNDDEDEPKPRSIITNNDQSTVNELIGALKTSTKSSATTSSSNLDRRLGDLKKHLSTAYQRNPRSLNAPLQDREKEKIERAVAYGQTKEEVSDWDTIVRENRLAEKLVFPLYSEPLKQYTIEERLDDYQPRTTLEQKMADVLAQSKHNLKNDDPLTEAERELLSRTMSLQEANERRAKLQKTRALVSYAERKLRWQNRIKSKRYRRLLKVQVRRKAEKDFQHLLDTDPSAALDKLEMLERDRIKERATLKHRSTGKWAKQIRHLAKKDPRLREALQEQLRRGRELAEKKKQTAAISSNQDEEDDEEDSDEEGGGDQAMDGKEKAKKEKWAAAQPMLQVTPRLITDVTGEGSDDDDLPRVVNTNNADNQNLMAEAFAEDDVMDEYRRELADDIDKEDEEAMGDLEAQLTVPGWNSWTGPGTENLRSNRTRRDQLERAQDTRRKNKEKKLRKWPMVKFSTRANESVRKLQVSDLPFPFSSSADFESNLEPPLGKEWNPQSTHHTLIEPSVQTRMGAIIQPITRELALKKKPKRKTTGGEDREKKKRRRRKATSKDEKKIEEEGKVVVETKKSPPKKKGKVTNISID